MTSDMLSRRDESEDELKSQQVAAPRRKTTRTRRAIDFIVVVVVSFNLGLSISDYFGFGPPRSVGIRYNMYLFGAIGVCAGMVAAYLRRSRSSDAAIKAYRIAVWCLFLAFWQGLVYGFVKESEDRMQEVKSIFEEREKWMRENPDKWHVVEVDGKR